MNLREDACRWGSKVKGQGLCLKVSSRQVATERQSDELMGCVSKVSKYQTSDSGKGGLVCAPSNCNFRAGLEICSLCGAEGHPGFTAAQRNLPDRGRK